MIKEFLGLFKTGSGGKHQERSVIFEILTVDGRGVDKELPALESSATWEEAGVIYLIDQPNQLLDRDTGLFVQLVNEQEMIPHAYLQESVYNQGTEAENEKALTALANRIVDLAFARAKGEQFEKVAGQEAWNRIMWLISIPSGVILVIAALQFFKGGG